MLYRNKTPFSRHGYFFRDTYYLGTLESKKEEILDLFIRSLKGSITLCVTPHRILKHIASKQSCHSLHGQRCADASVKSQRLSPAALPPVRAGVQSGQRALKSTMDGGRGGRTTYKGKHKDQEKR